MNECLQKTRTAVDRTAPNAEKKNFLSQEDYDKFPLVPWFDVQGRVIPDHPELPLLLRRTDNKQPQATRTTNRLCNRNPSAAAHEKAVRAKKHQHYRRQTYQSVPNETLNTQWIGLN